MSSQVAVSADSWLGQGDPTASQSGALATDLFEQHSKMVLAVCRIVLRDPVEAEDAMQQTFVSAYRSILAGSEPSRPAPWLAAIARNECLDRIRARNREPLAEQTAGRAPGAPDALNAAIAREDLHTLGRTIRELPTQQREALLLHEFHGLPYRDVAAAIGVSESAIASLLFRARSRLRSVLHRAYASVPIPALWNAFDHLLARGPAAGTAVPAVAKLGAAAVAVGLTAGGAVVVEHDIRSHHRQPPPPPPARSVSPASAPTPNAHVARVAVAAYTPRVGRPAAVQPRVGRAHRHTVSRARSPHSAGSAGAARARPEQAPVTAVSAPHPGRSETTTPPGRSRPATDGARSGHGPSPANRGRAPGRLRLPKTHGTPAATKPGKHASSPVSSGRPAVETHGNGTPGDNAANPSAAAPSQQHGNGTQGDAGADHGNGHAGQGH